MVKVSKRFHVRRKGAGKNKIRRNPHKNRISFKQRIYMENHSGEYNRSGGFVQHHKFYEMRLIPGSGGVFINKRWGRIGSSGQEQREGPFNMSSAQMRMAAIESSKRSGGYF